MTKANTGCNTKICLIALFPLYCLLQGEHTTLAAEQDTDIIVATRTVPASASKDSQSSTTFHATKIWGRTDPIDSYAVNGDGTRVAVTIPANCIEMPREYSMFTPTDLSDLGKQNGEAAIYSRTRHDYTDGNNHGSWDYITCNKPGLLKLLNEKGNELWSYPSNDAGDVVGLYNPSISRDGKFIAAEITRKPCKNKQIRMESIEDSGKQSHRAKTVCNADIALFDSMGKLLWSHTGRGLPKVSPDGKYVMVIPYVGHNRGGYVYGYSWQLFSQSGKLLSEETIKQRNDALLVLNLSEDEYTKGPFSENGKRFIFANNLWEDTPDGPHKVDLGSLAQKLEITRISGDGNYLLNAKGKVIEISGSKVIGKLPEGMSVDNNIHYPAFFYTGEDLASIFFPHREFFSGRYYAGCHVDASQDPAETSEEEEAQDALVPYHKCNFAVVDLLAKPSPHMTMFRDIPVGRLNQLSANVALVESDNSESCLYSIPEVRKIVCLDMSYPVAWENGNGLIFRSGSGYSNYRISKY